VGLRRISSDGKHAVQRILFGGEATHYPAHFSFQFPGTGNGVSDAMQHAAHGLTSYSEEHHGSKAAVRTGTGPNGQVVYARGLKYQECRVVSTAEYQATSAFFMCQTCHRVLCPGCKS
jgi:hypothetical protein